MYLVTALAGEAKARDWNAGFIRQNPVRQNCCRMNPAFLAKDSDEPDFTGDSL